MKDATTTCYNCGCYLGANYNYCSYCMLMFCDNCIEEHEKECKDKK